MTTPELIALRDRLASCEVENMPAHSTVMGAFLNYYGQVLLNDEAAAIMFDAAAEWLEKNCEAPWSLTRRACGDYCVWCNFMPTRQLGTGPTRLHAVVAACEAGLQGDERWLSDATNVTSAASAARPLTCAMSIRVTAFAKSVMNVAAT